MIGTDELVRQLYEAAPEGFVEARAAAVEQAKRAGDREAAKRLAGCKKPTVAAWVVNLLALRRPELIDQLVELAAALRDAQRGLDGEQLRELTAQRRQVVSALVGTARELAIEAEPALRTTKLPLAEVEATLTAALAEPAVAAQVRSGRLIRATNYAGFGEVPRPRLRLVTDDAETERAVGVRNLREEAQREREQREREQRELQLRRELSSAQAAQRRADTQLERAEAAERDAGHTIEDIEAELAELERRRTEAQAEAARRKQARRNAEREAAAARRQVGDVQSAMDELAADTDD